MVATGCRPLRGSPLEGQQPPFTTLSIFDEEAALIAGGSLQWVPVRRRLAIGAFGTNAYRAARAGEPVVEDHVESPGQKELYIVVRGRAAFTIGDGNVEAPVGTLVFVSQPDLRRRAVALEDETVVLAVGGWRDRAYAFPGSRSTSPRKPSATTTGPLPPRHCSGRQGSTSTPRSSSIALCCHARLGRHEAALPELHRAIEINPDMRQRAEDEQHLASLGELPDRPAQ